MYKCYKAVLSIHVKPFTADHDFIVFNQFYLPIKSLILEMIKCLNIKICKYLVLTLIAGRSTLDVRI